MAMPIHDWTRVRAGTFHHFHQRWIAAIGDALNTGRLPPGYFAMAEQRAGGPEPDVVTLRLPAPPGGDPEAGGVTVAEAPPQARFRTESDAANYARRAARLPVRPDDGELGAVIAIVSPGHKDRRHAVRALTRSAAEVP